MDPSLWAARGLHFPKHVDGWTKVQSVFKYEKQIESVQPYLILYAGTGTAWFDDIAIRIPSGGDHLKSKSLAHSNAGVPEAGLMD